jgi:hypothetical protein
MRAGQRGERYILNSADMTYRALMTLIAEAPEPDPVLTAAGLVASATDLFRRDPVDCSAFAYNNTPLMERRIYCRADKAIPELEFPQTSMRTAVEGLLASLRAPTAAHVTETVRVRP